MINLEELTLCFCIEHTLVHGNDLQNDIIHNLSRLNRFHFNIRSIFSSHDLIDLSNESLLKTFVNLANNRITSYIDHLPDGPEYQCHAYSHPYELPYYDGIGNNFPGGLFKCVRSVFLFGQGPFEHEFFLEIARSFPFVEKISICNYDAQRFKFNNNVKHLSIVEYPHLKNLVFICAHRDYVEQVLCNSKTFFSQLILLEIDYASLQKATKNFRRNQTRINCSKVKQLCLDDRTVITKRLRKYFPNAQL